MFDKAAKRKVSTYVVRKIVGFRSDESGSIAIFVMIFFVMMLYVGGIGVDVMRSEMRRVAYHQTLDRASLAASNIVLPPSQTPVSVAQDWWDKAGLGDELTVDNITPTITGESTASSRVTKMEGSVRSYNWFMTMLSVPYFDIPMSSAAQQGVSKIEVLLTLDITGSMAQSSGSTTKIEALRQAASNFVTIMKYNRDGSGNYTIPKDPNNLVSIGLVPYASNVNVPVDLRNQFTVSHLSWWNTLPLQGIPGHNCLEIDPSTFGATELSTSATIPMAAVTNISSSAPGGVSVTAPGATNTNGANGGVVTLGQSGTMIPGATVYNSSGLMCNNGDDPATPADESATNLVMLPTTNIVPLKAQIASLKPKGNTSIAVGMRWATALMDDSAQPIYTALRGSEPAMAGRPANNNDGETRKIIVLMTDGNHVSSRHIRDDYKSGLSPIYRGEDGRMAIRYTSTGTALTNGLRPGLTAGTNTCSGWVLAANREYFVPHLKNNAVRRQVGVQAEGAGTGTNVTGGCDPRAWLAAPAWTGSGVVRQLDWSEVWRYASVDWMIEQLYMRSNVVGTTTYNTVYNTFVANYLTSTANMDALLNTNCDAAKAAGFEIFGIILGDAGSVNPVPIQNCSSPGLGYFYNVTSADDLNTAFEQIAVRISDLRLTQ